MKNKLGRVGSNHRPPAQLNNHPESKPFQLKVNPDELPDIECHKCKNKIFVMAVRIKRVSAIISPDGRERYVHISTMICAMCQEELPEKP